MADSKKSEKNVATQRFGDEKKKALDMALSIEDARYPVFERDHEYLGK